MVNDIQENAIHAYIEDSEEAQLTKAGGGHVGQTVEGVARRG